MALHEIHNYLMAFVKLSQIDSTSSDAATAQSSEVETSNQPKKTYLLGQIQSLLNELTLSSTTTLDVVSSTQSKSNSSASPSPTSSPKLDSVNSASLNNKLAANQIDPKSVASFRAQTFLCSECYGDLFIV